MARGYTHVLGLDIGSSTIKAVELQRTGSGIEVLGRPVVVPTPPRSVEDGVIVDAAAVTSAVSDLIKAGGFHTKNTIASVGGTSSVVVRITEVPKMSGKELDEAIQWELDRQTPFPIEQTYYDYQPVDAPDADPNAQNMEVLIAVAQEDMIDTHVSVMTSAKLLPQAIDVEPLAISRALVEVSGSAYSDQTVAIVHIGANSTLIIVVRRGLLGFVRTIPTAGNALTQAITQNFMGDETLAEQVKKALADVSESVFPEETGYAAGGAGARGEAYSEDEADSVFEVSDMMGEAGFADEAIGAEAEATQLDTILPSEAGIGEAPSAPAPAEGPTDPQAQQDLHARQIVYEAIATPLVDLAGEVQASLNFYRRQHRNEEIDRILLSGGSAVIPGLGDFIAAETGVTVELADPFAELLTDENKQPGAYLRDIGPTMVVAVGLALRDMVES